MIICGLLFWQRSLFSKPPFQLVSGVPFHFLGERRVPTTSFWRSFFNPPLLSFAFDLLFQFPLSFCSLYLGKLIEPPFKILDVRELSKFLGLPFEALDARGLGKLLGLPFEALDARRLGKLFELEFVNELRFLSRLRIRRGALILHTSALDLHGCGQQISPAALTAPPGSHFRPSDCFVQAHDVAGRRLDDLLQPCSPGFERLALFVEIVV